MSELKQEQRCSECVICNRWPDKRFVVYQDEHWIIRHSDETRILGYFLLESRRHIVDLSLATEEEIASYGIALAALMRAIRESVACERVYTFSLGESVPHYHLHVIPRNESMPRTYRGRGIMQYPLQPAADETLKEEVCARVSRALNRSTTLSCR